MTLSRPALPLALLPTLLALALLGGCGGPPQRGGPGGPGDAHGQERGEPPPHDGQRGDPRGGRPGPEQAGMSKLQGPGYAGASHAVSSLPQSWRRAESVQSAQLLLPQGATPAPVLIYLPGLGESDQAGLKWRQAWAGAGYAVLSLQPLDEDAQAWSSELARAGEFKALSRRHLAPAAAQARLQRLLEVLSQAQALSAQGQPGWRELDWSRLALAGYDLGSQTALQLTRGPLPAPLQGLKAVLALGPVPLDQLPAAEYSGAERPLLSITSPMDEDVTGLIATPREREQAFARLGSPQRLLLSLQGMPHTALAGNEPPPQAEARHGAGADSGNRRGGGGGAGGAGGRQRGGGGGGMGGMGGGPGGEGMDGRPMARVPAGPDRGALREQAQGLLIAQRVAVAFLDRELKGRTEAAEWLAGPAQDWMGPLGQLRRP